MNNGSEELTFPGKVADLNGAAVSSQKFDGQIIHHYAVDSIATLPNSNCYKWCYQREL